MDCLVVKVPLVALITLDQTTEEASSPVGTGDFVLEQVDDGWVRTLGVEIFQSAGAVSQISEGLVIELVHGGAVQAEIASHVLVMVAGSSQGNLGTNTVTSQSGHTNLMLVHKSGNVICGISKFLLAHSSHPKSSV